MRKISVVLISAALSLLALPVQASSLYGALYEVGNLTAATGNGSNTEAVLTYVASADGFIAITTNIDGETEWWTSDEYATTWTRSTTNPLEDYDCTQPGRHGIHTYADSVYFGADCAAGATVFEITGLESVEVEHVLTTDNELAVNYPTATPLNGNLYMFFNSGYSEFDGTTWTDVIDAPKQPTDAPLEASRQVGDQVYLSFTNGVVAAFDGSSYSVIGDEYLEGITTNDSNNLPAVQYYNDMVYVGNQDFDNGATLFRYDLTDTTADISNWDQVFDLDANDTIINKMLLSASLTGDRYLVYFTSNHTQGVNMFAMDESETVTNLVDSGLGGTDPENNSEVISAIRRTIVDRGTPREVMLFSTQNTTDQTKIFVLALGKSFAFTPLHRFVPSTTTTDRLTAGHRYRVTVPASKVKAGDQYTLYVDGEAVNTVTARGRRAITLRYKGSSDLDAGATFAVSVGRKLSYGSGDNQLLSNNEVMGGEVTVTVQ